MADITCAVCGEPWEAYGVDHGDMVPWQAKLFRQGAGCPACEGDAPEGVDPDESRLEQARGIIMDSATDDPHAFESVNTLGLPAERVKWERPDDPIVHSCQGCGAKVHHNLDETIDKGNDAGPWSAGLYWSGGRYAQLYNHDHHWDAVLRLCIESKGKLASKPPARWCLNDRFFCPGCVEHCGNCGELFASEDLALPEGKCHVGDAVCEECMLECEEAIPDDENQDDDVDDEEQDDEEDDPDNVDDADWANR